MAGLWGPQIMAFYKAHPGATHYRPRRGWGDWDSCDYKIEPQGPACVDAHCTYDFVWRPV